MSEVGHLRSFLELVLGDRNPYSAPERHAEVPLLIADRWRSWGLPVMVDEFEVAGTVGRNVLIPPDRPDDRFALVIAHHDTVPHCPGADDNGSGMATVDAMAAARSGGAPWNVGFALTDFEEGHPLRWSEEAAALPGEDLSDVISRFVLAYGTPPLAFHGARRLLERLRDDGSLERLEIVLNFETVGVTAPEQKIPPGVPVEGPLPGDFLALVGNQPADGWVARLAGAASIPTFPLVVPGRGFEVPDSRRSDHAVFWDDDLPAIMLTDTADLRNQDYHQPTDTEVDLEFLAGVVATAAAALDEWTDVR